VRQRSAFHRRLLVCCKQMARHELTHSNVHRVIDKRRPMLSNRADSVNRFNKLSTCICQQHQFSNSQRDTIDQREDYPEHVRGAWSSIATSIQQRTSVWCYRAFIVAIDDTAARAAPQQTAFSDVNNPFSRSHHTSQDLTFLRADKRSFAEYQFSRDQTTLKVLTSSITYRPPRL